MPNPPFGTPETPGPVRVQWCSGKHPHDETITPNQGESQADFIDRVVAQVDTWMHDLRPSNDCTPPYP